MNCRKPYMFVFFRILFWLLNFDYVVLFWTVKNILNEHEYWIFNTERGVSIIIINDNSWILFSNRLSKHWNWKYYYLKRNETNKLILSTFWKNPSFYHVVLTLKHSLLKRWRKRRSLASKLGLKSAVALLR
jgi:hypothetical protein